MLETYSSVSAKCLLDLFLAAAWKETTIRKKMFSNEASKRQKIQFFLPGNSGTDCSAPLETIYHEGEYTVSQQVLVPGVRPQLQIWRHQQSLRRLIHQGLYSSQKQEQESVQSDPWFLPGFDSENADNNKNVVLRIDSIHIITRKYTNNDGKKRQL